MKENTRSSFTILQFLYWSSMATFGQFYTYYLAEQGYYSSQVGFALTICMIAGLVGQYVWGVISDYTHSVKKPYQMIQILLGVAVIAFAFVNGNMILTFVVIAVYGFVNTPSEAILDSWIMGTAHIDRKHYGLMRGAGALSYAITSGIMGTVYHRFGWNQMFIVFTVIVCINVFFINRSQDSYKPMDHKERIRPWVLLKNKKYAGLLLYALLVNIGNMMILSFYPYIFNAVGGNEVHVGYAASFAALVELPVFLLSGKLMVRFKSMRLFLFASVCYIIRVALSWQAKDPTALIIAAGFQAVGFSLTMALSRTYIAKIAPESMKTSAQTIFSAAYFGVSGIISSLLGGYVWRNLGHGPFFMIAEIAVVSAFIVMLFMNLTIDQKKPI